MINTQNKVDYVPTARLQLFMITHGALGVLFGLVAGYALIFSVLEVIQIWPFPGIDAQLPGTTSAWRAAHTGPIMNGLLCLGMAFALSFVDLSRREQQFIAFGLVFTVYANICFYVFAIFGNSHGLTGGHTEKFGPANLFDLLAFIPALIAALVTPICIFLVARGAIRSRKRL